MNLVQKSKYCIISLLSGIEKSNTTNSDTENGLMAVGNMEGIEVGEMGEGGQEVYISSYKMGPGALMYSIVTYLIILCV